MVTEAHAWSLLERYCDVFRGILFFDIPGDLLVVGTKNASATLMLPSSLTPEIVARSQIGCRLRIAVDLVNALSSCHGFDPVRHSAFWRRAVSSLWTDGLQPTALAIAFEDVTLCSFNVIIPPSELELGAVLSETISTLWRQFVMVEEYVDAATKRVAMLQELRESDGGVWTYPLRPLNIRFAISPLESQERYAAWSRVVCTLTEISHFLVTSSDRSSSSLQSIELYLLVDPDLPVAWLRASDLAVLERLARLSPRLVFKEFSALLCCRSDTNHFEMLARLGSLLRCLAFDVASLQTITFFHSQLPTTTFIGALWSLVAHAPTLRVVNVHFREHHYTRDTRRRRHIAQWITYAMQEARDTLELCRFPDCNVFFNGGDDVATESPLMVVAEDAVHDFDESCITHHDHGARVQIDAGTMLFPKPFSHQDSSVNALTVVSSRMELPLIISLRSANWLGVSMPGYGLCWANTGFVGLKTVVPSHSSQLRSLCLLQAGPGAIEAMIKSHNLWSLTSLSLSVRFPSDLLLSVLVSCPRLQHLGIIDDVLVLPLLLEAYETRGCNVKSLVLTTDRERTVAEVLPLFQALSDRSTRVSCVLSKLWLDNVAAAASVLESIVELVHVNTTLRQLHLSWAEPLQDPPLSDHLESLKSFCDTLLVDDQVVTSRLAFLSIVQLAEPPFTGFRAFDALVCSRILAFATPMTFRRLSWTTDRQGRLPMLF